MKQRRVIKLNSLIKRCSNLTLENFTCSRSSGCFAEASLTRIARTEDRGKRYGMLTFSRIIGAVRKEICDAVLWLRYPYLRHAFKISSHLSSVERVTLYELSRKATTIAEIGSFLGASACCFCAMRKVTMNNTIICIDTWDNDAMTEGKRDTWKDFETNTAPFRQFLTPIRGLSSKVVEKVRNIAPILDLLFIDGDHSYAGVKLDWETYKTFLRAGSIVVFHDYGWAEGVRRVVHEDVIPWVSSHNQLPNMWWGKLAK